MDIELKWSVNSRAGIGPRRPVGELFCTVRSSADPVGRDFIGLVQGLS